MGVYYNPVEDITNGTVGKFINTHDYNEAMRQLPHGHHLYALCDRLIFKQAVCVDDESDFDEFFGQYAQGLLISFQLIALPEDAHQHALRGAGL